jgi:F-type H+-transporting ATPase subunit a
MTTAGFGLATFIILHYMWLKTRNIKGYIKDFMQPNPVFLPINVISELALPLSLSFRLFGNLLGGVILLGMVYGMFPVFLRFGVPVVLHAYLDLFAGSIQAFIFTILSMTFIRSKLPD